MLVQEQLAAVVTAPFFAQGPDSMVRSLAELLALPIGTVAFVDDRKSPGAEHADTAYDYGQSRFPAAGKTLKRVVVDLYDTAVRWRPGILGALSDASVQAVFVFPGDIACLPQPTMARLRSGWDEMLRLCGPDRMVIGQYVSQDRFKTEFDELIGSKSIAILFEGSSLDLSGLGLSMMRSEFFVIGRRAFESFETELRASWGPDPTIQLTISCLRSPSLDVRAVDLGDFADHAGTRSPLGQMHQVCRFVAQLAIDRIIDEMVDAEIQSQQLGHDDEAKLAAQLSKYDRLRDAIWRLSRATLAALDKNRAALEREWPGVGS